MILIKGEKIMKKSGKFRYGSLLLLSTITILGISLASVNEASAEDIQSEETQIIENSSEEYPITSNVPEVYLDRQGKAEEMAPETFAENPGSNTAVADPQVRSAMAANEALIVIHRIYNPNNGEHLHTQSASEKDYLVSIGWYYEGTSMKVNMTGNALFRVYNPNSGEHFWTANQGEIDSLRRNGWVYEGNAWSTPDTGIPMYRLFNQNARNAGSHHYTTDAGERDGLVKAGWKNEGIAYYVVAKGDPINNPAPQRNFFGITRQAIIDELNVNGGRYLGTPFRGVASNNPELYMQPGSGMNCAGFVAAAIRNAGGDLNRISAISNNWGSWANGYNWRNALNQGTTRHEFPNVAALLNSGLAEKGDIFYFEPNFGEVNFDCHIGFFWGNTPHENVAFHQVYPVNRISNIYSNTGYSKVILYKM